MRNNKVDVSAGTVQQWAEETLEEWLAGYTEVDPKTLIQYKLSVIGPCEFRVARANPYGSSTLPRQFRVTVMVQELP